TAATIICCRSLCLRNETRLTRAPRFAIEKLRLPDQSENPEHSLKIALKAKEIPGNDLLSHIVANAVPSARAVLTAVFGMGTGVSPSLWSPDISFVTKEIVKVCARIWRVKSNL